MSLPQGDLFPEPASAPVRTRVVARPKDFDSLFSGYTRLRAVSYAVSLHSLLELFGQGFETIEVVVGDSVSEAGFRLELASGALEAAERVTELIQQGRLRVLIPPRVIHSKLYLLEGERACRAIASSANLTETARRAARQVNYAWYLDLEPGHPRWSDLERDYQAHSDGCSVFMGDLVALLREKSADRRRDLLEAWLSSSSADEVRQEARRLLQEAAEAALAGAEHTLSIRLPEAEAERRQLEKLLSPIQPTISGGELCLSSSAFRSYVQDRHGVPLMRVDREKGVLRLAAGAEVQTVGRRLEDPRDVAAALEHLEAYFEAVDAGRSPDPVIAKASQFEALLAVFASVFAHEFMRLKRRSYGAIDSRGPRIPYISGRSQNGKSTFLKFALRLITGRPMEPLAGGEFAKRKILGAASIGTAFPLVFDDVVIATHAGLFEEVLKSYWEAWWSEDCVAPQLVISSNTLNLPPWAKSRLKRVDFDVHFGQDAQGKAKLARLFQRPSPIFGYFAALYLDRLALGEPPPEDELAWAREVFARLYRFAGRAVPGYFPDRPIEALFDPGRGLWRDLLYRMRKARVRWEEDRAVVEFAADLQHYEVREFEGALPSSVTHRRRGNTLIIESPQELRSWLEGGGPEPWWGRVFGRFTPAGRR